MKPTIDLILNILNQRLEPPQTPFNYDKVLSYFLKVNPAVYDRLLDNAKTLK